MPPPDRDYSEPNRIRLHILIFFLKKDSFFVIHAFSLLSRLLILTFVNQMNQSHAVYQVSDLSNEMRRLMETSYPEIWIEGELSSLSTPASGHLYFSLKDAQSQLRCAMFKGRASINRYRPKMGDLVRVRAKISVYTARGDLQCIVQHIEEAGEGLLQRRFEELKQSLNQQGLFNQDDKKLLPSFAKKIGLITSPSGAAVKDILSTLKRRCPSIPVTIYPAVVQGDTASKSIINALEDAIQHKQCDVLILSRGGGSLEDLWCFNDEQLAHTIYNCPIPIVSGVGHEVDITIADLVSDLRAATPTAAAEIISPDIQQLLSNLKSLSLRLPRSIERVLQRLAQNVDTTGHQLVHPRQQLQTKRQNLDIKTQQLQKSILHKLKWQKHQLEQSQLRFHAPTTMLSRKFNAMNSLSQRLKRAQDHYLQHKTQGFTSLGDQLNLVSPLATLDRGFSIARDNNNTILRNVNQIDKGESLNIQLSNGELICNVSEIKSS